MSTRKQQIQMTAGQIHRMCERKAERMAAQTTSAPRNGQPSERVPADPTNAQAQLDAIDETLD